MSNDILDKYSRDAAPVQNAGGLFTPDNSIFSKYDRSDSAEPVTSTNATPWQDAEALENAAAAGIQPAQQSVPAKPGRGVWQAIKDYPGHVLHGLIDTAASPGNVLASPTPSTSESLIPAAQGLAGLASGSEFPRAGVATVAEKIAPSTQAINRLVEAVGPENVPAAVNRLQSNPRLTLADVSDPVRTMAQGLIDPAQPKAQNAIVQAVKERAATRQQAANTAFTETMGPSPNVTKMVEGLQQRATNIGKTAIQPAVEGAKPVDITPVINSIDKEIAVDPVGKATLKALKAGEEPTFPLSDYQSRLFELRQQLRGSWNDRDQMFLDAGGEQGAHWLQANLRAEAQNLLSSASGAERNLGGKLMNMRNQLVDQIDKASSPIPVAPGQARIYVSPEGEITTNPKSATKYIDVPEGKEGLKALSDPDQVLKLAKPLTNSYKAGLSKFRDAKQIGEAFESGFDTLKNRSGLSGALEDSPQAFRDWMKDATPEEVVARRLGTRADIDQKINSVKNGALKGETITQIPYNQEKLRALFGNNEANRLIRVMKDSADEAATNAKLIQGSKTAETLAGKAAMKVPEVEPFKLGSLAQTMLPGAMAEVAGQYMGSTPGLTGAGLVASGLLAGGIKKGAQSIRKVNALARNEEFAKRALATGPARKETINALLSHPKVVSELNKRANALTSP